VLANDRGMVIRFAASEVRPSGRPAAGVAGMRLERGQVVSLSVLREGGEVLTVGRDGGAKRAPAAEYPMQGRGGKGVQAGASPLAWCGAATDLHVPTADGWTLLRAELVPLGRRTGGATQPGPAVAGRVVPETA
jgi:hypothetical protein